jgi:hypothetical protein
VAAVAAVAAVLLAATTAAAAVAALAYSAKDRMVLRVLVVLISVAVAVAALAALHLGKEVRQILKRGHMEIQTEVETAVVTGALEVTAQFPALVEAVLFALYGALVARSLRLIQETYNGRFIQYHYPIERLDCGKHANS